MHKAIQFPHHQDPTPHVVAEQKPYRRTTARISATPIHIPRPGPELD